MKKILLFIFIFLTILPFVSAEESVENKTSFNAETTTLNRVVIKELNNPIIFESTITSEKSDLVEIYTIIGAKLETGDLVSLSPGTNTIEIKAHLDEILLNAGGFVSFEYYIKSTSQGIIKQKVVGEVTSLGDEFLIAGENIELNDENAIIIMENKNKIKLNDIKLNLKSEFFEYETTTSFAPKETVEFTIPLDKEKAKKIESGMYLITAEIEINNTKAKTTGHITYNEQKSVKSTEETSGLILRKNIMTKENTGNVPAVITISVKRDILSRLFTMTSEEPRSVNRNGVFVQYNWKKIIQPGETYTITTTTNYTLPLIIILIILLVAYLVRKYTMTSLVIEKRVYPVKTKEGKFTIRVQLTAKARRNMTNVKLYDKLPRMTKLFQKFGKPPSHIDEKTRTLVWNLGTMKGGEERIISYIIYSEVDILGRFVLPVAYSTLIINNKHERSFSNHAYFMAETTDSEDNF